MEIFEIIRDALPEAIGGLIVAAIVAFIGYLYTRWRKTITKPVEGEIGLPSPSKPPVPKIPYNLPQPGEFIGREREKAEVREALASRTFLVSIDGIGGIGKTALALEVAHNCLKASESGIPTDDIPTFDAFVWTTAKDRELALSDILDTIARTLDYPYITQLPPEEKPSETAKLLRAQKCLLIVDNFETITDDAVRDFLLNLPDPSKALITSREQKLRQARAISLRGMERGEALTLILSEGKRLGLSAVEKADEKVLLRLYEATGGAPLAIKWAVGQMKQRGQSLDTVLDYLYEARGDVFENIFARSWGLLRENAKRALMVIPIFATSASKPAIEAASDVHKWDLDEALGQLVEMWLVEASEELDEANRRYSIHPLTRAFAMARLGKDEGWGEEARLRAAKHFLALAQQNDGWGNRDGFTWFELEFANTLATLDWCYNIGEWRVVVELMWALMYFMGTRGYWRERIQYGQMAAQAAKHLGSDKSVAWMNLALSWIYLNQGNCEEAEACAKTGKALFKKAEDWVHVCETIRLLGKIARVRGEINKARELAEEALEVARVSGYEGGINGVYCDLGDLALQQRTYEEYVEAERLYREALRGFEKEGNQERIASRHIDLGNATFLQDRLDEAREHYKVGLALSQRIGRQDNIACAQYGLARVGERAGNFASALELAHSAQEIFERLGMRKEMEETRELVEMLEGGIAEARKRMEDTEGDL